MDKITVVEMLDGIDEHMIQQSERYNSTRTRNTIIILAAALAFIVQLSMSSLMFMIIKNTVIDHIPVNYHNDPNIIVENGTMTRYSGTDVEITIPYGVKVISSEAFADNNTVKVIHIPASVTKIEENAFSNLYLENITVERGADIQIIDGMIISPGDDGRVLVDHIEGAINTEITVPEGVVILGERCFANSKSIEKINLSSTVKFVGVRAFYNCGALKSADLVQIEEIKESAFDKCSSLSDIVLPDTLTTIGTNAFAFCSKLSSIVIPESVRKIGDKAFNACISLESVTVKSKDISFGSNAFWSCNNLKAVYIDDLAAWCSVNFAGIDANPLYYAGNLYVNGSLLTDLKVPESVRVISKYVFAGCVSLKNAVIPSTVNEIQEGILASCGSLESVTVPFIADKLRSDSDVHQHTFGYIFGNAYYDEGYGATNPYYNKSGDKSLPNVVYIIPNSLKSVTVIDGIIPEGAFYNCKYIEKITLPEQITSIEDHAFENCISLCEVLNTEKITSMGESAFSGCISLTEFTLPAKITVVSDNLFKGSGLVSAVIPDGVTSIGSSAFAECVSLTSVKIAESVTRIGENAFDGCVLLEKVNLPSELTVISDYLFYKCGSLEGIVIPDKVTSIKGYAFAYTNLTDAVIPDSVTTINIYAFWNCTELKSVTMGKNTEQIFSKAFEGCEKLKNVYISDLSSWCNIVFDDEYANPIYYASSLILNGKALSDIVIPDGLSELKNYTFYNYTKLKSVTVPGSVKRTLYGVFCGCSNLERVEFGDGLELIGGNTFANCRSLKSIALPNSVKQIYDKAFYGCTSITSVTIPEGVVHVGYAAFARCSSLKEIIVKDTGGWYFGQINGMYGGYNRPADESLLSDPALALKLITVTQADYSMYKKT